MSKSYSVKEVVKEIATTIKQKVADYEVGLVALRKKELEHKHGKLAKSELCVICAGPEFKCDCALQKSEALAKKTPPDISEKTMHKLKDEYGHDEKGKEKAYGTAWSIEDRLKKEQMAPRYAEEIGIVGPHTKAKAAHGDGPHDQRPAMHQADMGAINSRNDKKPAIGMKKSAMASSSASAINPPKARPATPVAAVNHEMSSFQSISSKPPISSMGRNKAAASGSIMGKAESPVGNRPQWMSRSLDDQDDKPLKVPKPGTVPGADPVKIPEGTKPRNKSNKKLDKDEMGGMPSPMMMSEGCPECGGVGSHPKTCSTALKNPKTVKKMEIKTTPTTDVPDKGSGGETKKIGNKLKKSGIPEVQGVAGKQPVGQDGGGANKAPRALADVKGMAAAPKWGDTGLPELKAQLAKVKGGVSWLKSTHTAAHRVHPAQAAPKSQRFHGALPLQRSEMLGNGSPSGHGPPVKIWDKEGDKPSKKPDLKALSPRPDKKKLLTKAEMGSCAMCKKEEHAGKCMKSEVPAPTEGLSAMNHNRTMLRLKSQSIRKK